MSDLMICTFRKKYGHTWHRMSLLRPGVIKHKPNQTLLFLKSFSRNNIRLTGSVSDYKHLCPPLLHISVGHYLYKYLSILALYHAANTENVTVFPQYQIFLKNKTICWAATNIILVRLFSISQFDSMIFTNISGFPLSCTLCLPITSILRCCFPNEAFYQKTLCWIFQQTTNTNIYSSTVHLSVTPTAVCSTLHWSSYFFTLCL